MYAYQQHPPRVTSSGWDEGFDDKHMTSAMISGTRTGDDAKLQAEPSRLARRRVQRLRTSRPASRAKPFSAFYLHPSGAIASSRTQRDRRAQVTTHRTGHATDAPNLPAAVCFDFSGEDLRKLSEQDRRKYYEAPNLASRLARRSRLRGIINTPRTTPRPASNGYRASFRTPPSPSCLKSSTSTPD